MYDGVSKLGNVVLQSVYSLLTIKSVNLHLTHLTLSSKTNSVNLYVRQHSCYCAAIIILCKNPWPQY